MPEPDCYQLYVYSKDIKGEILEVGSYKGRSTICLALSSPKSNITAVDSYPPKFRKAKSEFIKNTYGYKISHFFMPSVKLARKWQTPLDLIMIDGNHSYRSVKADLESWYPHLKSGSYMMFHDYNVNYDTHVPPQYDDRYGIRKVIDQMGNQYFDKIITDPGQHGFAICRKF